MVDDDRVEIDKKILVYPTDTVWGIGTDVQCEVGTRRVNEIKKVGSDKPLSLLFSSMNQLSEYLKDNNILEFIRQKREVFNLGVSLLVQADLFKNIPSHIHPNSELISMRLIERTELDELSKKYFDGRPFTSTSLNLTGEDPIVHKKEALDFYKTHAPNCVFVESSSILPSGLSSTMIHIQGDKQFKVLREGANTQKILKILNEV